MGKQGQGWGYGRLRRGSSRDGMMSPVWMLAVVLSCAARTALATPVIDWRTVGDPGNANSTTGYGAVATSFRIATFEWTNAQYVQFLNAVDPNGTNPNAVYNASMGSDARGGISFINGNAAGAKYVSRTNMADKPVNYVSWWDAARVANWLHNGAPVATSSNATASAPQNTGAYTLGTLVNGSAPARNAGAQYFVPTQNEWYKAAYFKGGATNAGYWKYATMSNSNPTAVQATTVGSGTSGGVTPVISGNLANYNFAADWNGQNGNVTTVGTNGGPSAYGAFDMGGNVWEWNDLDGSGGSLRGFRGGSFYAIGAFDLSSLEDGRDNDPGFEIDDLGFRLASASASAVPEIDPAGIGSVVALVGGVLTLMERRRSKVA